jgi:alkylhydroperoxidase family enzyme
MSGTLSQNTQATPEFEMRGNRFQPLTWDVMTAEQQAMTRAVLDGKRGSMQGPYNVLLRSPEVGQLAQQFGAQTRFNSSLPLALNELAILLVARDWTAQFVWWAHRRIAEDTGLSTALIQAIATGQSVPEDLQPEVRVVHQFCSIGAHSFTAMNSLLFADLPPFVMAQGQPAQARSMNFEGLRRRGFSAERISAVKAMHKALYRDGLSLGDAMARIAALALEKPEAQPDVNMMLGFLQTASPQRGIVR